jgi:hypothetical protein
VHSHRVKTAVGLNLTSTYSQVARLFLNPFGFSMCRASKLRAVSV